MKGCLLKVLLLLLASVLLAGCETRPTPEQRPTPESRLTIPIGSKCVVQFRRDALGAAATLPIPPNTDNYNGAQVSLGGPLKGMSPDWIIIGGGNEDCWIATSSILMLKVEQPTPRDNLPSVSSSATK
jgi:hypothetical protein